MDRFQYSFNKHYHVLLYSKETELSVPTFHSQKGGHCKNSLLPWVQYLRDFKILQRTIGSHFTKEALSSGFQTASQHWFPDWKACLPAWLSLAWPLNIAQERCCDHLPLTSRAPIASAIITIDCPNEPTIN